MKVKSSVLSQATIVLILLLLLAPSLPPLAIIAVVIIETVLIMTVSGAARHLPSVIRAITDGLS
jgi:hypothetical protein